MPPVVAIRIEPRMWAIHSVRVFYDGNSVKVVSPELLVGDPLRNELVAFLFERFV